MSTWLVMIAVERGSYLLRALPSALVAVAAALAPAATHKPSTPPLLAAGAVIYAATHAAIGLLA